MLAERAELIAELRLDDKMSAGLSKASRNLAGLGKTAGRVGKGIAVGLGAAGTVAAVGIAAAVRSGISSLEELENANTATVAALEASGLAASVSAAEIRAWSEEIETASDAFIDDKEIQRAANTLIRLGGVTRDSLREAMEVATDLAVVMGTDTESAAKQLAKALKNPLKGMTALSRAGVRLTDVQEDQIKALVKAGKAQEAQALLLDYVAEATEGAAKAAGGPYADAMNKLREAQEEATMALATGFLPVLTEVADFLSEELAKPGTMEAIRDFGQGLADGLREGVKWAKQLPWEQIVAGLRTAAGFAKDLINVFTSMPAEAQAAIIALAGLNKLSGGAVTGIVGELGKGLIRGVLGMTAGVVNLTAGKLIGGGGLGGAVGGKGGAAGGVLGKVGGVGGVVTVALAATSILALHEVYQDTAAQIAESKQQLRERTDKGVPTLDQRETVAAIKNIDDQLANPFNALILGISGARGELDRTRASLVTHLNNLERGTTASTAEIRNGFTVLKSETAASAGQTQARVGDLIAATQTGLSGVAGAARGTTQAINSKNWSPTINVPVNVATTVSIRSVTAGQAYTARYGNSTRIYEP